MLQVMVTVGIGPLLVFLTWDKTHGLEFDESWPLSCRCIQIGTITIPPYMSSS